MTVRISDALKHAQDASVALGGERLVLTFSSLAARRSFVNEIERDVGMRAGELGNLSEVMFYGITMRVAP